MARTKQDISKYQAAYYALNKEEVKARVKKYYGENRDKVLAERKLYRDSHKGQRKKYNSRNYLKIKNQHRAYWKELPYARHKWYHFRSAAKQRGIDFYLTFEEFCDKISSICFYCESDRGSIDRIDSLLAYTVDNCVGCCRVCNRMKSDFKIEVFLERCRAIAKVHKEI